MTDAQVGAYKLLRQIGEGGMGAVWLAEHAMLGRSAAIKLLHPKYTGHQEIVTRFFNEARAASSISDPGIVQIFDFGYHVDGSAYIVMELLAGETLERRVRRHRTLAITDTLRILRQVASSLGAAHVRGVVHRDLKPANIFLVRDPEVTGGERAKILDFGIAKLIGDESVNTSDSAVMGTPTYMSPEQCRGGGQIDQRADVYALGCVLFRALTGQPPFDARGIGDIIAMHLREPAPVPSSVADGIPPAIDQLVLRCLAKDPDERFASGRELVEAIDLVRGVTPDIDAMGPAANKAIAQIIGAPTTLSKKAGRSVLPAPRRPQRRLAGVRRMAAMAMIGIGVAGIAMPDTHEASLTSGTPDAVQTPSAGLAVSPEPSLLDQESGARDANPSVHDATLGALASNPSTFAPEPSAPDATPPTPEATFSAVEPKRSTWEARSVLVAPKKHGASVSVAPRPKKLTSVPAVRQPVHKPPDVSGSMPEAPRITKNPSSALAAPSKPPLMLDDDGIPVHR